MWSRPRLRKPTQATRTVSLGLACARVRNATPVEIAEPRKYLLSMPHSVIPSQVQRRKQLDGVGAIHRLPARVWGGPAFVNQGVCLFLSAPSLAPHIGHVSHFCNLNPGPLEPVQLLSDQGHARRTSTPIHTAYPAGLLLEPVRPSIDEQRIRYRTTPVHEGERGVLLRRPQEIGG